MNPVLDIHRKLNNLRICPSLVNITILYLGLGARKPVFAGVCEQQRRRPACASSQSNQRLCYSRNGKYHILTCYKQNFNFLGSLCS